jgi:hypothetical protein
LTGATASEKTLAISLAQLGEQRRLGCVSAVTLVVSGSEQWAAPRARFEDSP